ncbi:hypothetical protein GCM10023093_04450 [Nemorincola caseinilytica]|uniref:DUF3592 domain-containing protein n=1 Tax=Nemorincola caseinilytica TaxID=2054315 RepID=A0ABP8N3Y5_9BACT
MPFEIRKYKEPLTAGEVSFLVNKEAKERRQYYSVYRVLMAASFLVPFITSWYRAYEGAPNAFSYIRFFVTTGILLTIVSVATYASYRHFHHKLIMDLRERTKTIETNFITKKIFVATKNSYYFYTDSRTKISIEVSPEYFTAMKEGDEVSMEYTTHSKLYLGYF